MNHKKHILLPITLMGRNTVHNVVLTLVRRLRRWPNIKTTPDERLVFFWDVVYLRNSLPEVGTKGRNMNHEQQVSVLLNDRVHWQ